MPALMLYFLGPPRIELDSQIVQMDTRKAAAMLAYLALTGEQQTRDSLASFLWPEFDNQRAKAALRRTLSTLKTAVGDCSLIITRETIGLVPEQYWCDVTQFEKHIQAENWLEAVSLYRDDFMAGFSLRDASSFDDWQLIQSETHRREMSHALEALCYLQEANADFNAVIDTCFKWLQMDPLREDAHRQLMLLYARSGQRNLALNQFRECVRILDEELGVAPLAETVSLYEAIRDNQIAAVPDLRPTRPLEFGGAERRESIEPAEPRLTRPPLIGRKEELHQMLQLYRETGADGRLLAVEGEAGIGKTRLAEDFLEELSEQGAAVLSARCYEGENNLAYASLIQILRSGLRQPDAAKKLSNISPFALAEAGRLLPELLDGQNTLVLQESLEAPGAQNRFYEGVGQVLNALLAGPKPGIVWLDDAHWLDSASLELVLFLIRRWYGRPYLILLCWRTESLPAAHPFYQLLASLQRESVSKHLYLTRFTKKEVSDLLTAVMPAHSQDLPQKLYSETEGLPYFVVEYLNALQELNLPGGLEDSWDLPRTVRDLLLARLAQIDEKERQVLQTAAAISHAFDFDLLHLASGRSEDEIVTSLDTLIDRGLLVEQEDQYDFTHAKLRQLAYEDMGLARRRLLHRRVAESLEKTIRHQTPSMTISAEIANHYRQAGLEAVAADYFVKAGDQARAVFAHQEGIYYYQSALALGFEQPHKLHEACGDMNVRLGEYALALTSYETAASLAESADLGRLEHKIGQVYMRQGAWVQAQAQLALAQEMTDDDDNLARLLIDWSYVAFNLKDIAHAKEYAQRGRQLAHTPQVQAQSENISGLIARHEGASEQALGHFEAALILAQKYHLPDTQIASLNNLALTEATTGQSSKAQEHFLAALDLCTTFGDRHREAALHNNLADLFHQVGDEQRAMAELKTAVTIYAEIGGRPGDWKPEIWKLTEW